MQLIKECTVRGDRLDVTTDPAFRERYLWDDFFIEYSDDIGLDRMDPTVPLAPNILNVAPLVWLSGETYEIDALDADLAQALEEIRQVIKRNIPGRAWDGQLKPARLVTNEANTTSGDERISLLFTAGVDSVYSSLSHHPRLQNLITVWGNETALDFEDRWRLLSRQCERFAEQFGHRNFLIKTNAKEIIKRKRIAPDIRV